MNRLVKLCAWCVAGVAQASGFYLGDNGAKAMLQGGAFVAQADDATAMQHNPAGLAQQPGFSFLADLQVLRHDVSFLRQDTGFDPANPLSPDPKLIETVRNVPAPFLLPFFAASFGFPIAGRNFTVGLGLFAPPSQGKYHYPAPSYAKDEATGRYVERPNRSAPQRYALITNDIVIAYPTLSLAYDLHKYVQVGVSAQLTVSNFSQSQTMYGGDALNDNPQRQLLENPDYDALVAIDLPGQVGVTGILGVMVRPTEWLSFGGSVRPPIPFKSRGKITVDLPAFFTNAGATVVGANGGSCSTADQVDVTNCEAELSMTMPLELKFGARILPIENLGINVDYTYQGWNSIQYLLLSPQGVSLKANPGAEPTPIPEFRVQKQWKATHSVRVGATYRIFEYLSASAGAMYETGAADTKTYSVDWTHPSRFIFTGGVTGHLGPIDLIVGALFTPTVTTVVEDSIVVRGQTNPEIEAGAVGNGIYTSGAWGMNFGVRGHFGAAHERRPMIGAPEEESAPAPAAAPSPAAAPAAAPAEVPVGP